MMAKILDRSQFSLFVTILSRLNYFIQVRNTINCDLKLYPWHPGRQHMFISKGNFCPLQRGGLRHFMERRKVLRRQVAATMLGSLWPIWPFTDVIPQTGSCVSSCKYFVAFCSSIAHFHFPLSQQGHKLVPKYCRKSEDIFKLLGREEPPIKTKTRDTLRHAASNGTPRQPHLLEPQSSVFCWAASCLHPSCRSLGRRQREIDITWGLKTT